MKDFDKKKIVIFIIILGILFIGIRNNYKMIKGQEARSTEVTEETKKNQTNEIAKEPQEKEEHDKSEDDKSDEAKPRQIYVHITGAVNKPGLYKLDEGKRLDDLVKLCQGLKKDADTRKINLSMILEDQMRLHILAIGEEDALQESLIEDQKSGPASKDQGNKKVNVNKASKEELMTLPGIGEKRALDIIEYRKNSKFRVLDDLKNISGIGDKSVEKFKDQVVFD